MLQPQADSASEVPPPGALRPSAGCVRPRLPSPQVQCELQQSTVWEGGRPAAPQPPPPCWQGAGGSGQ